MHTTQDNNDMALDVITEEVDLGVLTTSDLKPAKQCLKAANKANSVLRLLKLSFQHLNKKSFTLLYKTYVRPHLEYCIQTWSPYLVKDIQHLERVQRRATKLVHGFQHKSYEDRLTALNLTTLEQRRLRGDLIETYKLVTHKEDVDPNQFFHPNNNQHLRGHHHKIFKKQSRLNFRKNFFSQRVVNYWNELPSHVVDANSVNMFKNRLDKYWHDMSFKIGPRA